MIKRLALLIWFLLTSFAISRAQHNTTLPFLTLNPTLRSIGMGDVTTGYSYGMHLYGNPTSFLSPDQSDLYVSHSINILPLIGTTRNHLNAISVGYKFAGGKAIMAGLRHFGGLEIRETSLSGDGIKIYPVDFSFDLGYAQRLNPRVALYARGSFINSYNGRRATLLALSAGIHYTDSVRLYTMPGRYTIGFTLDNIGKDMPYSGNAGKTRLPSSFALGGEIDLSPGARHRIATSLSTVFVFKEAAGRRLRFGIGAEYEWHRLLSIRGGYHKDNTYGYFTIGGGIRYYLLNIEAAYRFTRRQEFDILTLGVTFAL